MKTTEETPAARIIPAHPGTSVGFARRVLRTAATASEVRVPLFGARQTAPLPLLNCSGARVMLRPVGTSVRSRLSLRLSPPHFLATTASSNGISSLSATCAATARSSQNAWVISPLSGTPQVTAVKCEGMIRGRTAPSAAQSSSHFWPASCRSRLATKALALALT